MWKLFQHVKKIQFATNKGETKAIKQVTTTPILHNIINEGNQHTEFYSKLSWFYTPLDTIDTSVSANILYATH